MRVIVSRQDSRGQEHGPGSGPVDAASSERPPIFRAPDGSPQVVKRDGASWVVTSRGPLFSRLHEAEWVKEAHTYRGKEETGGELKGRAMFHRLKPQGRVLLVLTSELSDRKEPYEPQVGINKARATDRETDAWLRAQGENIGKRGQGKGILMNYTKGEE